MTLFLVSKIVLLFVCTFSYARSDRLYWVQTINLSGRSYGYLLCCFTLVCIFSWKVWFVSVICRCLRLARDGSLPSRSCSLYILTVPRYYGYRFYQNARSRFFLFLFCSLIWGTNHNLMLRNLRLTWWFQFPQHFVNLDGFWRNPFCQASVNNDLNLAGYFGPTQVFLWVQLLWYVDDHL